MAASKLYRIGFGDIVQQTGGLADGQQLFGAVGTANFCGPDCQSFSHVCNLTAVPTDMFKHAILFPDGKTGCFIRNGIGTNGIFPQAGKLGQSRRVP